MQHVPHVIVQGFFVLVTPAFQRDAVGQDGKVRIGDDGRNAVCSLDARLPLPGPCALDAGSLPKRFLIFPLGVCRLTLNGGHAHAIFLRDGRLGSSTDGRSATAEFVCRASVEPSSQVRDKERVLDVGQGGQGGYLGVYDGLATDGNN